MKVSVLITTYNHERYIAQAVNSALMQAVDFDYEVVISEDHSSDHTREIVLAFQRSFPDRVRLLSPDKGDSERDRARGVGGKTGFVQALKACRGQYVALLDDDDYWTDVHKLQKQVDFLESHPDFAISFHNVTVIYEDGSKEQAKFLPPNQPAVRSLEDLILDNFIQTNSAVFRRGLFGELPDWFHELKLGDWPIHIMNAQHGKIGYIDEVMAAYRVHHTGFWTSLDLSVKLFELIKMLDYVDVYLEHKYRKQVRAAKAKWYSQILRVCYDQGELNVDRRHLGKMFWYCGPQERRGLVSLLLRQRAPTIYKFLKMLRSFSRSATTT